MTAPRTEPPITEQQNSEAYLRMLSAQRRLYADVKRSSNRRLAALVLITIATMVLGAFLPGARDYVGGVTALGMGTWVMVAELREHKDVGQAASIQELFDTGLFRLPWHAFLAERPSEWVMAAAAKRGSMAGLEDWYQPKTLSNIVRPLDVIVCQRANLDYGVGLHRAYARILALALGAGIVVTFGVGIGLGYSLSNFLFAIVAPLAPVGFTLLREIQAHRESASNKSAADIKVAELWRRALADPASVTDDDCRGAQDCILGFRKANARVPEWLYDRLRDRNEAVMLATCSPLVDEAMRNGHALRDNSSP
jgi:hypothetical protein